MMGALKQSIKRIILAYFVTGMVYSVAGYLQRSIMGRQEVFSPLIGLPMDIAGWPWMVYADLKHIGIKPQDVLTMISIVMFIVIFVSKELLLKRSMK